MITCSGAASQYQARRIRVRLRVRVQVRVRLRVRVKVRVRLRVRLGEVGQEGGGGGEAPCRARARRSARAAAAPGCMWPRQGGGAGARWGWWAAGLVRGGAGARWGWCAVGLVGVLGDATQRGYWAALQGPAAQPAPKRPQLSSRAQRAAVCFLLIGAEMKAGSESALPSSRPPISRPAPTLRTCRRTGGSTISWTVTTSRTWIATRTVEGVRLEDGRMAAAWLCCMWPQG